MRDRAPLSRAPRSALPVPKPVLREEDAHQAERAARQARVPNRQPRVAPRLGDHGAAYFGEPGRPLPAAERMLFENRLGHDLSRVRIHAEPEGQRLADAAEARSLAVGEHIAFAEGEYNPGSAEGRALLAHEIAHTLQQTTETAPARQPKPQKKTGIGRTPPDEAFHPSEGVLAEDEHVLFDFDSADLSPNALATVKKMLESHVGPVHVAITGYASAEGDAEYNRNLSAHRAVAVRRALQPLLPPGSTILLYASGEVTDFGKAPRNRRAGIRIMDEGAPSKFTLRMRPSFDLGTGLDYKLGKQPHPDWWFKPQLDLNVPGLIPDLTKPVTPDPFKLTPEHLRAPWLERTPDYFDITAGAHLRGVQLDPATFDAALGHWNLWYSNWLKLGLSPDMAKFAADLGTSYMVDNEMRLHYPSRFDRFKAEDEAMGYTGEHTFNVLPVFTKGIPWLVDQFKKKSSKDKDKERKKEEEKK